MHAQDGVLYDRFAENARATTVSEPAMAEKSVLLGR